MRCTRKSPQARSVHTSRSYVAIALLIVSISAMACVGPADTLGPSSSGGASRVLMRAQTEPGCAQDERVRIEEETDNPLANGEYCPVSSQPVQLELHYATQTTTQVPSSAPLWQGELIAMPEYGNGGTCPGSVPSIRFAEYIPATGETAEFLVPGPINYESSLGYTVFGHHMAKFRLPEAIINSVDGKYSIYGGTVSVTCYSELRQISRYVFGVRLEIMTTWAYEGMGGVRQNRSPGTSGGPSSSGWAFRDATRGFDSGSDAGWFSVLSLYVNYGTCTAGWEVWVDGDQKCSGANAS